MTRRRYTRRQTRHRHAQARVRDQHHVTGLAGVLRALAGCWCQQSMQVRLYKYTSFVKSSLGIPSIRHPWCSTARFGGKWHCVSCHRNTNSPSYHELHCGPCAATREDERVAHGLGGDMRMPP